MGFLNRKQNPKGLARLPSGCFTVDASGTVIVSTVPQVFPAAHLGEIARIVLETLREAETTRWDVTELIVDFEALKITARGLGEGVIIFLAPRTR